MARRYGEWWREFISSAAREAAKDEQDELLCKARDLKLQLIASLEKRGLDLMSQTMKDTMQFVYNNWR